MVRRLAPGLALIPLAALLLSITACHSHHVAIAIRNQTGAALQLLEVDYPSASFGADKLAAGTTFRYRIQVQGNGPLTVMYTSPAGQPIEISGPELSNMQHGQVDIVLLPGGKAEFHP
ncbi:MAG: hypothetical protein ACLGP3_06725, partial [Acidobacteriota bacterium]